MSLDAYWGDITDRDVHFPAEPNGELNATLQSLVWLTIPVGIGQITAKNASEFWHRADLWQKSIGVQFSRYVTGDPGNYPPGTPETERTTVIPIYVKYEDVANAISLRTNASPKSRAGFLKDLFDAHQRVHP